MNPTLIADDFDLIVDARGRLVLKRPGLEDVTDVRLRRAFPWSSPGRYVSVRSSEGKELLLISDPATLPPALREMIERQLRDGSFIPRIERIVDVDVRFGYQQWQVQTDRGMAEFRVKEREDIRFMTDGRYSVKDADGNVYELPRLDQLDHASQRALQSLL